MSQDYHVLQENVWAVVQAQVGLSGPLGMDCQLRDQVRVDFDRALFEKIKGGTAVVIESYGLGITQIYG
jgi:hypothetical protein